MAPSRRQTGRLEVGLAVTFVVVVSLALGLCGLHVSRAEIESGPDDEETRQLTVFGVAATPESKAVDTKLAIIKAQLDKLLPKHGFKLLDAQSKSIGAGESVTCDLRNGYRVVASLVQPVDENGKVQLRCELFRDEDRIFSSVVKTPPNQLFFCQRALNDGSQLLIGIGAR
jgi:hypothetical protein